MPKPRRWAAEEEQYLRDHFLTDHIDNIGNCLNRTRSAIKNRVAKMPDLYKRQQYNSKKISLVPQHKKSLPPDRWQDAEDFRNMMAIFKRRLIHNGLKVGKGNINGLIESFNQYQVDMGR